jgi:8-oxo-dGTP diphosphatase
MDSRVARSGIVLIEEDRVALIERRRDGQVYHVFPGGKIEASESSESAAVREAQEELGLSVRLGRLVAVVDTPERKQFYFLARRIGGRFGTGTGEEFDPAVDPHKGSYRAIWLDLATLDAHDVRPRTLARLLLDPGMEAVDKVVTLTD